MVAGFCVAAVEVEVSNVLVGRGVTKEKASEVVFVELGALIPCPLHTDTCTKELEVSKVRLDAPPAFKGGDTSTRVYATVVEVDRME
jgi:hypothetical protein